MTTWKQWIWEGVAPTTYYLVDNIRVYINFSTSSVSYCDIARTLVEISYFYHPTAMCIQSKSRKKYYIIPLGYHILYNDFHWDIAFYIRISTGISTNPTKIWNRVIENPHGYLREGRSLRGGRSQSSISLQCWIWFIKKLRLSNYAGIYPTSKELVWDQYRAS